MSEFPQQRGAIAFECRTLRIEALSADGPPDDELVWHVYAQLLKDEGHRGIGILIGHLAVANDGNWGQVQVQGLVSRDRQFPSESSFKNFMKRFGVGFLEEMYDVARRALDVTAAMLDCSLDLPKPSPPVDLTFITPASVRQAPLIGE